MITVFTYRAVHWENGRLAEGTVQSIGFADVAWIVGTKLGEFRLDEQSGEWSFYLMAILPHTALNAGNLRTIADKLTSLNDAQAKSKEDLRAEKAQAQGRA